MKYKRCTHCGRRRKLTQFHGANHDSPICRNCTRLRKHPPADVVRIIELYGDLDEELTQAVGVQWPYRLHRASKGAYAR